MYKRSADSDAYCMYTRPLEEGDIVNIDVTVFIGGHHGDCSETFLVGIHLIETNWETLM